MNKDYILLKYLIIFNIFHFHIINCELLFVYEHCRHGARGPLAKYMSKLTNNKNMYYDEFDIPWNIDGEDLTIRGKIQHYILGIRNRYKYSQLLNFSKYNPNELLTHLTEYKRSNQSAYYQLLGMYSPLINESNSKYEHTENISKFYYPPNYLAWNNKSNNIGNNIGKNIIKEAELSIKLLINNKNNTNIFLNKDINEFLLNPFLKNRTFYIKNDCKNFKKYMEHNYNEKYKELIIEKFEKKYENKLYKFFKYRTKEDLYVIKNSISKVDNYLVNYHEERNMDNFFSTTKIDKYDFYKTCISIYKWWLYKISCDKNIGLIESSKLMEDLVEYMDTKINRKNKIKMIIDFGHDVTVGSIQTFMHEAFGADYEVCEFACNVFFELHENSGKNEYYVEYYIDDELKLNISYGAFKEKVIDIVWSDKEKEDFCFGNIYKVLYPNLFIFFIFFIVGIFILIFIVFVYKCHKKYSKKQSSSKHKGDMKENNGNDKEMELINNN